MSSHIRNIRDGMRQMILTAKPEYLAGGAWMTTHINRVPSEKLKPPMIVIELDVADPDEDGEFGDVNVSYFYSPVLYVVMEQEWDGIEIAEKTEEIRDLFAPEGMISVNGVDVAQILNVGRIEWGEGIEANQFLAEKNGNLRAGAFTLKLQASESLNG